MRPRTLHQDAGRGTSLTHRLAGLSPEHAFVGLALPFGIALLLVTPPGDDKDAAHHFARAYLLAEGDLAYPAESASVPTSVARIHRGVHLFERDHHTLEEEMDRFLHQSLQPATREKLTARKATYPPPVYLGSALFLRLGLAIGLSPVALLYLARGGNLLVWLGATWLALRLLPLRPWALVTLALTPAVLFQASTVGADSPTNSAAFLFVALALRAILAPGFPVAMAERASLVAAAALLGLMKPGYWPLAAMVVLIPGARFPARKDRWLLAAAVLLAVCLPGLAWELHVWDVGMPALLKQSDPEAQLRAILEAPLRFAWVLVSSIAAQFGHYLESSLHVQMHHGVRLPLVLQLAHPLVLGVLCASDGPDPERLTRRVRLGCLAIFALCVASVATLAYVGWNPPGAGAIAGVHGRYLIPAAPLLFVAVPGLRSPAPSALAPALALGFSSVALGAAVVALAVRYF